MKRSRFSEEQIVYAIHQADAGTPVGDLCRQLGVSEATFYTWERRMLISRSANSDTCARWKGKTHGSSGWWRISRSTSTCCRTPCEKKSKVRPPPRTRPVVSRHVFGELRAGLPIGPIQLRRLVSTESCQGAVRPEDTDSGSRSRSASVRVSAHLGVAATRGLAREPQTGPEALLHRGVTTADAGG